MPKLAELDLEPRYLAGFTAGMRRRLTSPSVSLLEPDVSSLLAALDGNAARTFVHAIDTVDGGRLFQGVTKDRSVYRNQIICYEHGCWTDQPIEDVPLIWIGALRHAEDPQGGFAGRRAIWESDVDLPEAMRAQKLAEQRWKFLSIEALAEIFAEQHDVTCAFVADALRRL